MHLLVGVSHLSDVTQSLVGCRRYNIDFGWLQGLILVFKLRFVLRVQQPSVNFAQSQMSKVLQTPVES
jgi:hypothetical protein